MANKLIRINSYEEGIDYAHKVVRGEIRAPQYQIKVCQRFLDYLEKTDWRWTFNTELAQHVITWFNQLKLSKGPDAGKPFVLQPFQVFLLIGTFGFVDKADPALRMVRNAGLYAPRKVGKSELSAGIAAYILKFGEIGTQVFSLGLDRAQSSLIFNTCKTMIQNGAPWISSSYNIRQFDITCPSSDGSYKALSRDSRKTADGLNPELVLADESSQLPREMIEVMESGMVARKSPLIFHTTTAAFDKTTKFYENLSYYKNMLDGIVEDNPRFFFCIFELDEGLDWRDPEHWDMINPMYGISVFKEAIEERVKEAMAKPSMVNEVLTKTFNRYTSNERVWIDTKHWEDSPKERPMGEPEKTFMTIDLSLSRDLCCVALLERFEMEQYYATFQFFLPEEGLEHVPIYERGIFHDSIARGTLKLTPGNVADYEEVEKYIAKICSERSIYMIGYDAWNASALVTKLHERGLPLKKIAQNIGTLSAPTKQLEKLIYSHAIGHEHDPMMLFQLQNCSLYEDPNLNIKIKRPAFAPHAKIDGVVCLIMGVYLSLDVPQTSLLRFDLL